MPAGNLLVKTVIKIVMADDHSVVRAGIRKVIEELPDMQVVAEVGDGYDLLPALARFQPDCLLIDVAMPDFNPIQTVMQIRADYPQLKILVVSAYADDVYVQGLLAAGVDGYHLKDQPLSDLKLALQRVLAGERWLSSPLITRLVRSPGLPNHRPNLTPRQVELLLLLRQGLDNQAIAQETGLSIKTIENHLTRLYRQLNVQSRLEAVNHISQHPELLREQARTNGPQPENNLESDQGLKILVVDDNARYRRQLNLMIAKVSSQARIFEAESVPTALHLAQALRPQLAFVDVVLSDGEDGIRCTRRIKVLSPNTRVVLISAYPDREFHRLGLEAGAVAFLDKKDLEIAVLKPLLEDII